MTEGITSSYFLCVWSRSQNKCTHVNVLQTTPWWVKVKSSLEEQMPRFDLFSPKFLFALASHLLRPLQSNDLKANKSTSYKQVYVIQHFNPVKVFQANAVSSRRKWWMTYCSAWNKGNWLEQFLLAAIANPLLGYYYWFVLARTGSSPLGLIVGVFFSYWGMGWEHI